ncbi:MAG: putative beta-lysine N-acetyltransferase [Methanosarcina sp.]
MLGVKAEFVLDYYNKRLKVMDYIGVFQIITGILKIIAKKEEIEKIIVYTPPEKEHELQICGFVKEGIIEGYYSGKTCHVFSSYPEHTRGISFHKEKEDAIIESCLKTGKIPGKTSKILEKSPKKRNMEKEEGKILLPEDFTVRPAVQADALVMAKLYREEFQFYPVPLHVEKYVLETMDSSVLYFLVEKKGVVVSLASAEMDFSNGNAEITDCVTIPSERGKGLIKGLITTLENELLDRGFQSTYTLCRASSSGINLAFASLGYDYTGRLVNNCRIGNGYEDMNIWCKILK